MTDDTGATTLSPDDAFSLLGNETRVEILRALAAADEPLSFSSLRDRVEMRDSGQFNYHLDKLTDHFVRRTDGGYELRQAGSRVVEAVLSGAVTETPVLERTAVEFPCHFCGAPVEVTYGAERVELYCTECSGAYAGASSPGGSSEAADDGYLGYHPLPPAGVYGRNARELLRAAWTRGMLELVSAASGVCPRCSATVDRGTRVCESHDASDGLCADCGRRHAVAVDLQCTNCVYDVSGGGVAGVMHATPLLAFVTARGLNPLTPATGDLGAVSRTHNDYDEEIVSTDPVRVRLTFTVDDDELALTIDGDLTVVSAEER